MSVDPLTRSYPWYTPYQFAGNSPIKFIDLDGLETAPNKGDAIPSFMKLNGFIESYKESWKHFFGLDIDKPSGNNEEELRRNTERYIKEKETAAQHIEDVTEVVNTMTDATIAIGTVPFETAGDIASTLYYGFQGDWENAYFSGAAIFIPAVSSGVLRMSGPLLKGSIKVFENSKEVLKDAFKIGNYGHRGTKEFRTVVNAIKKGGNFVVKSEDEAIELLNSAFKGIPEEAAHSQSKFGYRIEDVPLLDKAGNNTGHTGKHINYYDKANGVDGTITIGE